MKKSSQLDIRSLMPHPPRDFINLNTTNFAMQKSQALLSLEHNMQKID